MLRADAISSQRLDLYRENKSLENRFGPLGPDEVQIPPLRSVSRIPHLMRGSGVARLARSRADTFFDARLSGRKREPTIPQRSRDRADLTCILLAIKANDVTMQAEPKHTRAADSEA